MFLCRGKREGERMPKRPARTCTCIQRTICTLTNAKPIIIAAQTLKRCSINRKWLSPNFYFRLELCAIYHSERYEGGALGHAGRWYYSAITWGKMEDLRASKCVHVMAFPLVSRWIIRRYYIFKFFIVSSPLCLTLLWRLEILFVTIESHGIHWPHLLLIHLLRVSNTQFFRIPLRNKVRNFKNKSLPLAQN